MADEVSQQPISDEMPEEPGRPDRISVELCNRMLVRLCAPAPSDRALESTVCSSF